MKLFEIRKTKTATKTQDKTTIGGVDLNPHNIGSLATQQRSSSITPNQAKGKVASAPQTRSKVAAVMPSQDNMDKLAAQAVDFSQIDTSNEPDIGDDEGLTYGDVPEPVTPQMLPAVISKALANTSDIEIEWHMVKHLPGYLAQPIRALGRQVFGTFTKTPIEQIQVLANIGNGPNSDPEIQAITHYVRTNGVRNTAAQLHFEKVFPGYEANIVAYDAEGYTFLLVQDMMGKYVYSWPSKDSKSLPTGAEPKLINSLMH